MRLILRIYQPDEGRVVVLGSDQGTASDPRVGYLPEERGLYRRMTVRRVLRYFAQLKGIRRPDALIQRHLERLGAVEWSEKKVDQLSKGMAQKIQFIVAIIAEPELVILDEPFSGLDPVNLDLMRDIVRELHAKGTTVIFSTHDMEVAQRLCDRVFMIYQGKKVLDGSIDEIRQHHGVCSVRVRMAGGSMVPDGLPGVMSMQTQDSFAELLLDSHDARQGVLESLVALGEVAHFETIQPTLHDIFVRIAKPTEKDFAAGETSDE